jgi:formylglycine-generating enzyme required for sulfatase activity
MRLVNMMAASPNARRALGWSVSAIAVASAVTLSGCSGSPGGSSFADCADCPEMVVIPAGEFTMGSPGSELLRGLEPQHRVALPSFAVSKYEVTFAQWDACVAAKGCLGPAADDEGWGRDTRPVINVTWDMAKAYVEWLSQKTGKPYRLPSEAEWEYAARAGTTTPFSLGATITTAQANYNGSTGYGDGPAGVNRQQTIAVGSFPPNAFGLYDMHGNVSEWMEDCWHDGYADDAPKNASPYLTPECGEHAIRGGSWEDSPADIRAAARAGMRRDQQSTSIGFRIARPAG